MDCLGAIMPNVTVEKDVDNSKILHGRGLFENAGVCCYKRIQKAFIQKRLRRDLTSRRQSNVTVQIRDTFSSRAFLIPFKLALIWQQTANGTIDKEFRNTVDQVMDLQDEAERKMTNRMANTKRISIIIDKYDPRPAFLKTHPVHRHEELESTTSCFLTLLMKAHRESNYDHLLTTFSSSDPMETAEKIKTIIEQRCAMEGILI